MVAEEFCRDYSNFKVIVEHVQGLSAARNSGMKAASSPTAAFTDDDALPEPDWLEQLACAFENSDPEVAVIGGEIDPVWEIPPPEWVRGLVLHYLSAGLNWSPHAHFLTGSEWLCEVNSAYRIAPSFEVGGFPTTLGRIGDNLLSGENALNTVLVDRGFRLYFDPAIRVRHHIPATRLTMKWLRRRSFWHGVTAFLVKKYLREMNCDVPPSTRIQLPASQDSWTTLLNTNPKDFEKSLSTAFDLGFLFASQGIMA